MLSDAEDGRFISDMTPVTGADTISRDKSRLDLPHVNYPAENITLSFSSGNL